MKYRLDTHFAVGEDIVAGKRSYEQLREGLGDALLTDVYATMAGLRENPLLYQKRYRDFRIALTERFKFKVIYCVDGQTVYVIAILHPRQHPTSWMKRQ